MALLGPILVIAGFALYFATTTRLGRFRRVPWEFLAVSALGVAVSVLGVVAAPSTSSAVAALASAALFAGLLWFFFSLSMYGPREDRPRVGDPFPAFRLPSSDGAIYDSMSARGKRLLLIFYRGSW
ncbi:MAG TPA: hypothetical protein VKH41_02835 [Myxococcota bacterium]|nr:hypothetical protein [Myxococcota bacterium]